MTGDMHPAWRSWSLVDPFGKSLELGGYSDDTAAHHSSHSSRGSNGLEPFFGPQALAVTSWMDGWMENPTA